MIVIVTIGATSSLTAPLIATYAAPIPYFVLTTMSCVSLISSCYLEKYYRKAIRNSNRDDSKVLKNDTFDTVTSLLDS